MAPPQTLFLNRIRKKLIALANRARWLVWFGAAGGGFFLIAGGAQAATLVVSPASATFMVGSTFTVSLFVNSQGQNINTISATLWFPPDRLQLVSPSAGQSIISLWTTVPSFDNQTGRITLQGGIPGGITVNNGLITTLTFRVKGVGAAVLKFTDSSRVLLNDGQGTDALRQTGNGVYTLVLPPPAGPAVISETHPDQTVWYSRSSAVLRWTVPEPVDGFSYILNDEPIDFPDDISEGTKSLITYNNVPDGISYFHIKALKDGNWGGVTHFAIKMDAAPPAEFPVEIIPAPRTSHPQPMIQFATTDALSGLDHYELKIVPLQPVSASGEDAARFEPLFIDVDSPYVPPELPLGSYEVIIRAFDRAGNFREAAERLAIVSPLFTIVQNEGLWFRWVGLVPWRMVWAALAVVIAVLTLIGWRVRRLHQTAAVQQARRELPGEVQQQLEELKRYRSKYGSLIVMVAALAASVLGSLSATAASVALSPPMITAVSKNITNEEIFYISGKTEISKSIIIIYLQNLTSGETVSESVAADKIGSWFYRHDRFLGSGNYLLWVQNKLGEQLSPPSPQVELTVHPTALQFGASRLSFEAVYLGIVILALGVIAALLGHIVYHAYHGRKKRQDFLKEVKEAQESLRRGFAVLRRDIEAEIAVVKRARLSKNLSAEEAAKEAQLLKDLAWVEQYIGKEIWDIEKTEESAP